jgi:hypothetical protein
MHRIACEAAQHEHLRKNGVHLLVEARGDVLQELLRAGILMLQISGSQKPCIEISSAEVGAEAEFNNRFPASNLVCELKWHTKTANELFPEDISSSPDFAIFAHPSDMSTLEAAERFWMRHDIADDRVIACMHVDKESIQSKNFLKKTKDFTILNFLSLGLGSKHPMEPEIEAQAKICHSVYIANEKSKNPDYGKNGNDIPFEWNQTSERVRNSNRLAAMHHEVKRCALKTRGNASVSEILAHLSCSEHMRWMAEKAMDGWRWSGSYEVSSRDNEKLKHHLLVSFDRLDKSEIDKDYNSFIWAMDIPNETLEHLEISEEAMRMKSYADALKKN